jgi:hypothetical protein
MTQEKLIELSEKGRLQKMTFRLGMSRDEKVRVR